MTSASVSVNTQTPTLLSSDLPTATTIFNNGTSTVWVGGTPAVSPNIGTPIAPSGVIQIYHGGPVYAILDSSAGVTATATVTYAVGVTVQAIPVVSPQSDSWGLSLTNPADGTYNLSQSGGSYSWGSCLVNCKVLQTSLSASSGSITWTFNLYVPSVSATLALGSITLTTSKLIWSDSFTSTNGLTGQNATLSIDNSIYRTPPSSLKAVSSGYPFGWATGNVVPVTSGSPYAFSVWVLPDVYTSGLTIQFQVTFVGSTGTAVLGPANTWQQLSYSANASASTSAPASVSIPGAVTNGSVLHYADALVTTGNSTSPSGNVTSNVTVPKSPYIIQVTKSGVSTGGWTLSTNILPS